MIKVRDALAFRDILRKLCRHSPAIKMRKTRDELTVSSISTDELSFASAVLKEAFFEKWDVRAENTIEIESKTLYDACKIIKAKSDVIINLSGNNVGLNIEDTLLRRIIIAGLKTKPNTFELPRMEKIENNLKVDPEVFRGVIEELDSLLDETRLVFRKNSGEMVFSGKQRGMSLELILQDFGTHSRIENDISVEFPVKYLRHFSPLFCHFEELLLRFASRAPLIIEGYNEKWKLLLIVSKLDNTIV